MVDYIIPVIMMLHALIIGDLDVSDIQKQNLYKTYSENAPAVIDINIQRARLFLKNNPEILNSMYGEESREKQHIHILEGAKELYGLDIEKMQKISRSIHNVKILLFDVKNDFPCFLVVIEHNETVPLIDKPMMQQDGVYSLLKYRGRDIHGFLRNTSDGLWLAESPGKIAVSVNLLAVQRFVLNTQDNQPGQDSVADDFLVKAQLNHSITYQLLSQYKEHEFFIGASSLLDLAAWENVSIIANENSVEAQIKFHKNCKLPEFYRTASTSTVLQKVVKDSAAAIVIPMHDLSMTDWLVEKFMLLDVRFMGSITTKEKLQKLVLKKTGLDLQSDIFNNVNAIAVAVPTLTNQADLHNNVILLEVNDPQKAAKSIGTLLDKVANTEYHTKATPQQQQWQSENFYIALQNNVLIMALNAEAKTFVAQILESLNANISQNKLVSNDSSNIFMGFYTNKILGKGSIKALYKQEQLKVKIGLDIPKILAFFLEEK